MYATDDQGKFRILEQKKELYSDYLARLGAAVPEKRSGKALELEADLEEGVYSFEYGAQNRLPNTKLQHKVSLIK